MPILVPFGCRLPHAVAEEADPPQQGLKHGQKDLVIHGPHRRGGRSTTTRIETPFWPSLPPAGRSGRGGRSTTTRIETIGRWFNDYHEEEQRRQIHHNKDWQPWVSSPLLSRSFGAEEADPPQQGLKRPGVSRSWRAETAEEADPPQQGLKLHLKNARRGERPGRGGRSTTTRIETVTPRSGHSRIPREQKRQIHHNKDWNMCSTSLACSFRCWQRRQIHHNKD